MSSFSPIGAEIIPQGIDETSTAQRLALGSVVKANDTASTQYGQGTFIYASGAASTVVGSLALINPDDWSTSLAVGDDKGLLGIAMSINVASSYGFYQIVGKGVVKTLAGFLDNADCYLTSTAGSIDDAIVAGDYIYGMKGASAVGTPSTGLAEVEINNPSVKNAADVSLSDLGITATAAQLNKTAVTTAGTVEASKVVVVDANKATDVVKTAALSLGTSGSETLITATGPELNLAASVSAQTESIVAAGALSALKRMSKLSLVGAGAVTLAAPNAVMYGSVKIIEMIADNGDVTLALTNVQGQSSGTTATFNDVGDTLILVAGTSKWNVIKEVGIALS